jgi:hypothetical protein
MSKRTLAAGAGVDPNTVGDLAVRIRMLSVGARFGARLAAP